MSEDSKVGYEPRYREISLPIFLHCLKKYRGDDEALLKKLNDFMRVNTNQSIGDFKSWLKEQIQKEHYNTEMLPGDIKDIRDLGRMDSLRWVLSLLEEKNHEVPKK